jgi:hypothetical protein
MNERWLPAPDLEGFYEISNIGRLRRSGPGGPNTVIGRVLAGAADKNGYRTCLVTINGKQRCVKLHRLVAGAFIQPIPAGMQVNHKNGITHDNRVENLEIVTPSENTRHTFSVLGRKGRNFNPQKGESHQNSRLTDQVVREIRSLYESGVTQVEIARRFRMYQGSVSRVVLRKVWTHVA